MRRPWFRLLLLLLLLLLMLMLLLLHTKHLGVNLTLDWARRNAARRVLPWPAAIFVAAAFVEMDKLLVADK
jgi:hypothetical protein